MSDEARKYALALSQEEAQLIILRDELYEGSWEEMVRDLADRRDGKPFIFKLVNRIDEDLERIARLREFEQNSSCNLADYLEGDGLDPA